MNPLQTLETWLRKHDSHFGRAIAAENWRFWAVTVPLLLIAGSANGLPGIGLGVLVLLPILGAVYRKLLDAGLQPWLIFSIAVGLILLQFSAPMLQFFSASGPRAAVASIPIGDWLFIGGYLALQLFVLVLLTCETEPATNQYGPNPYEVVP